MTEDQIQNLFKIAEKATTLVTERNRLKDLRNKFQSYMSIAVKDAKGDYLGDDKILREILVAGAEALIVVKERELEAITLVPELEPKIENLNSVNTRVCTEDCQACDGTGMVINDHGDQISCALCQGTGKY